MHAPSLRSTAVLISPLWDIILKNPIVHRILINNAKNNYLLERFGVANAYLKNQLVKEKKDIDDINTKVCEKLLGDGRQGTKMGCYNPGFQLRTC